MGGFVKSLLFLHCHDWRVLHLRCWSPDSVEAHHPENVLNPRCLRLILDLTSDTELISTTDRVYWSPRSSYTGLLIVRGCSRQLSALELTRSLSGMLRYLLGSLTNPSASFSSLLKMSPYQQNLHSPVYLKLQLPASPPRTHYLLIPTLFWSFDLRVIQHMFWVFNVFPTPVPNQKANSMRARIFFSFRQSFCPLT